MLCSLSFFFFFFNDTATTEIYTLSLHDALPISTRLEKDAAGQQGEESRAGLHCSLLLRVCYRGLQVGEKSLPGPGVSQTRPEPSSFMTPMSWHSAHSAWSNTILAPSGDQATFAHIPGAITWTSLQRSTLITLIRPSLPEKAIFLPSGDQAGPPPSPTHSLPVPSAFMTLMWSSQTPLFSSQMRSA